MGDATGSVTPGEYTCRTIHMRKTFALFVAVLDADAVSGGRGAVVVVAVDNDPAVLYFLCRRWCWFELKF